MGYRNDRAHRFWSTLLWIVAVFTIAFMAVYLVGAFLGVAYRIMQQF